MNFLFCDLCDFFFLLSEGKEKLLLLSAS
uniref:Macaca fascicularis brain cDNA clone: QmoA-10451, similar to human ninein (GSK3B interacting protein) (NIN), transcriptvariant 2, mRNA, RefSeq: NM_020921.2 n=1 Tax=Macaca fascicularis TaxID=9541 RepID=I7GE14_MACFA|nr:unnamed protein product [Macaca fascicularis]